MANGTIVQRVTPKSDDPRNLNGLTRKSCNIVSEQLSNRSSFHLHHFRLVAFSVLSFDSYFLPFCQIYLLSINSF